MLHLCLCFLFLAFITFLWVLNSYYLSKGNLYELGECCRIVHSFLGIISVQVCTYIMYNHNYCSVISWSELVITIWKNELSVCVCELSVYHWVDGHFIALCCGSHRNIWLVMINNSLLGCSLLAYHLAMLLLTMRKNISWIFNHLIAFVMNIF